MNLSLKKLLKNIDVLYISEHDESFDKVKNLLKLFFRETYYTNTKNNAKDIYHTKKPSVIIVDIDLNEGSSMDFIKYIRQVDNNIPMFILTKNKDTDILVQAIRLNLIDYLFKPVNVDNFIFALNNCAKQILKSGNIVSKISSQTVYNYIEKSVIKMGIKENLTKNEIRLLELFLAHKNEYIKKEDIKKHIWIDKQISESAFKSLLNRLSNKIGKDTISNSFGVGYGIFT